MFTGINHIGIAARDVDSIKETLVKAFGAKETYRRKLTGLGPISSIVEVGDSRFELMQPIGDGVISRFIEKNGEGFHHISILTDDFAADCEKLTDRGFKVFGKVEDEDFCVAFIHPKDTDGILYEIAAE